MIIFDDVLSWVNTHLPLDVPAFDTSADWFFTVWLLAIPVIMVVHTVLLYDWLARTARVWSRATAWGYIGLATLFWPALMAAGLVHDIAMSLAWPFRVRPDARLRAWARREAEYWEVKATALDSEDDYHAATCRDAASRFELLGRGNLPRLLTPPPRTRRFART